MRQNWRTQQNNFNSKVHLLAFGAFHHNARPWLAQVSSHDLRVENIFITSTYLKKVPQTLFSPPLASWLVHIKSHWLTVLVNMSIQCAVYLHHWMISRYQSPQESQLFLVIISPMCIYASSDIGVVRCPALFYSAKRWAGLWHQYGCHFSVDKLS